MRRIRRRRFNPEIRRKLLREREELVKGKPRRFYEYDYRYTTGQEISPQDVEYVRNLKIPNKINNDSLIIHDKGGKVLYSYLDNKGRSIKAYSKSEIIKGFEEKYDRLKKFKKDHLVIVNQLIKDIKSKDPKISESALILYIIYKTGLRIGSNVDTKADVQAYGVSTLLNKHVNFGVRNKVSFDFIGKKGVRNTSTVDDPIIWENLIKLKSKNWSKPIFNNTTHNIVRNYLEALTDNKYVVKDFRTLKANEEAEKFIRKRKGPAPDEKTFKKWQLEVAERVSKVLGNTRTVALNDYIDPHLWANWLPKGQNSWRPKRFIMGENDI